LNIFRTRGFSTVSLGSSLQEEIKMKNKIIIQIIVFSLLTSCQFSSPRIINHEEPNIKADFSPFTNIGCKYWAYDSYACGEGSPLLNLGCTTIEDKPLLGGLSPNYPIATCTIQINEWSSVADLPSDGCVYVYGGQTTSCNRYVIYKDNKYQLIKTPDEFRAFYAPIESPEEALSFVLASDNFVAKYGQTKNKDYIYSVQVIEDTFVETIADGYIVHVFDTNSSCEPFQTWLVSIKVTFDGQLTILNRSIIYNDSSQSGCA